MIRNFLYMVMILFFLQSEALCQLKGAVPQSEVPEHLKEERKPENNSAVSLAKNNAAKLKKSLKLTEKQNNDLYKVLLEYETGVEKTNKGKLSKKDQYVKMNQLNMVKQDKMKSILTKEQYQAYIMSFP